MLTTNSNIVAAGKRRFAVGASALALVGLAAAPAASHAATVVGGGGPFNEAACASLGAAINGLEGEAASNPKAAAGLQQAADTLKVVARGQGCFVSTV